ncbi:MAG UNVERIFIED_CONTAM: hypothetical protein LVQ98_00620 [Rickettsiaceae bacterium]|jgi:hypothetical protein
MNLIAILYTLLSSVILPLIISAEVSIFNTSNSFIKKVSKNIIIVAFIGILLICISSFLMEEQDIIHSQYVPILDNLLFILGLSLFLVAILIIHTLSMPNSSSIIFVLIAFCLCLSYQKILREITYPMDLSSFYEMLFCSSAIGLKLFYLKVFHDLLLFLRQDNLIYPQIKTIIEYASILGMIGLVIIHFLYNIDSAEFLISSEFYFLYYGWLVAFIIVASVASELYASKLPNYLIIFFLVIFLASNTYEMLVSEKENIIQSYNAELLIIIYFLSKLLYYNQNILNKVETKE